MKKKQITQTTKQEYELCVKTWGPSADSHESTHFSQPNANVRTLARKKHRFIHIMAVVFIHISKQTINILCG